MSGEEKFSELCETKRKLLEYRIIHLEQLFDVKLSSTQLAIDKATASLDARLAVMNEFRGALKDQTHLFFTKSEHNIFREKVDSEITMLREFKAELKGKADQSQLNLSILISAIGIGMSLVSLFILLTR